MTDGELLPPAVLKRKAVVYVRQSTQAQVQIHLESQRRQYALAKNGTDLAGAQPGDESGPGGGAARRATEVVVDDFDVAKSASAGLVNDEPTELEKVMPIAAVPGEPRGVEARRASSISTVSITRAAPTIACCSG